MAKFGLIQDKSATPEIKASVSEDIENETLEVLLRLQYKRPEAKEMIKKALSRSPNIQTTEELLNEVYRQRLQWHKK